MTDHPIEQQDTPVWQDPTARVEDRVDDLVARMTLTEKVGQLASIWLVPDDAGDMAPMQGAATSVPTWEAAIADGLGHLTRPFGSAPVDPETGLGRIAEQQAQVRAANRFGIPAQVHEECLTGLNAWGATIYPTPVSWAATFDPDLVERMGRQIGDLMARLGIHQGLAPVLDVTRDLRWGRVEETLGEDPYVVGTMAAAYVRGLQASGVAATLKHFLGYSASRAGRNLAPVSMGTRELADVMLPPFEMALRAGARSVMNAYTDIDGIPSAADRALLTTLLRDTLGFEGTVVADYFSVAFLHHLHRMAADLGEAARLSLEAGIDVELPSEDAYGAPLLEEVTSGRLDEKVVDRALRRVLEHKCELGLLDPDWAPVEPAAVDLDPPEARSLARDLARRAVVLLDNDGTLPLAAGLRVALVGPNADTADAMLGCYTFPMHVLAHHPGHDPGLAIPTLREVLADDPDRDLDVVHERGCAVGVPGGTDDEPDDPEAALKAAVAAAAGADVCVAVLGDRAGLFGRGTSGEGCDVADLRLPGRQEELLERLLATGTPVVAVLLVGRPYDLSRQADRLAAVLCGFFLGEEGAGAVADVLLGRCEPSGRLPVSFPGSGGAQPATYLGAPLAQRTDVTSVDPTALYPFGHGLGYARATWDRVALRSGDTWATDGVAEVEVELVNESDRDVSEVVQVYLHDRAASVVRPEQRLVAALRVDLPVGARRVARIGLHADLTAFTGRDLARIVEPGRVELRVGRSSADHVAVLEVDLTGAERPVGPDRVLEPETSVSEA
ncbi:beta-glucosidase [Nocardioides sp. Root122]|uniref:glycoside hydrolase family 3 protein n=1 Tax=Nocardioides TaxID=1839 RepID=UPI0007031D16|nr:MULTISPECIES: glycoside hydrolase family 3 N-terminal domain-containing protein [Nocardioides]KQV69548.1 beta-glucosidase [Nocardioides sp. Root122]MCK9825816.1 glycoside hydrolase family 3 C-terminal domain-containing protein [Nocardioides cavernae]